jgi:integrase
MGKKEKIYTSQSNRTSTCNGLFSQEEISQLFPDTDQISVEEAVFIIMVSTGMRVEEVMALSLEAIDFKNDQISVELAVVEGHYKRPKSKAGYRKIPMELITRKAIQVLLDATSQRPAKPVSIQMSDPNKTKKELRHLIALNPKSLLSRAFALAAYLRITFTIEWCSDRRDYFVSWSQQ